MAEPTITVSQPDTFWTFLQMIWSMEVPLGVFLIVLAVTHSDRAIRLIQAWRGIYPKDASS
ncbi:MAG: hypothetical protein HRU30_04545 [Rhodobacteraceae bacterium]|nr:hypothetical protein [Paracoccaceae bacterium]